MPTIKHIIETQGGRILERWAEEAQKTASARGLSRPELMNIMPLYLASLVGPDGPVPSGRQLELVESHLAARLRSGFDLVELQSEFALLGRCVFQAWAAVPPEERCDPLEVDRILEVVHASTMLLSDMFVRHLLDDAQSEKRFSRLIRQAFTGEPSDVLRKSPTLAGRLGAAMPIVMEALGAATAAILLREPMTEKLVMTASAGIADERLTQYARSLAPSSFAGKIASCDETTTLLDAETTELDVTDNLRHSGIHALLGVRIPLQRELLGVMYVGLREHRPFSAREKRRIEAIAEQLALLIENVELYNMLEERIAALHQEQRMRDVLSSILVHDLRGPLAAARVAAQMADRSTEDPKLKRWTSTVLRSLDRTERMVSDLLDAQRVQAGERLPIARERCDVLDIVRDLVAELSQQHGDRFVVVAPEGPTTGNFGCEELRRAFWNLASNALKYGSADPVRFTVRSLPDQVEVEVHNEGPPIPADEQATLFEPFTRARHEHASPGGWGLGLAVVRGVAEAHGGSVDVVSARGRGTSFTMRLPFDGEGPRRPAAR
ncbi:sensor histidine kinase [Polyangium sorediatum]|uniref:histidine kinase n=1 Tax=Polyangium sorediatum TaxID=889274 RepID=A0ABT6NKR2_9BACT|nr:HAMP domain-containing sensor histidine kinase [Polyangium sorediatum]MDI1428825.1 HAMP domain-containing sensor histidine kinase [Polyangium sorediatum]